MKKNIFIGILIILNVGTLYGYILQNAEIKEFKKTIWVLNTQIALLTPPGDVIWKEVKNTDCITFSSQYWVTGSSMEPLIQNGAEVSVIEKYYTCSGKVSRWDIIVFQLNDQPLIKIVKAIPGDIIKFESEQMFINAELMKNSIGEIYRFSPQEINLMKAYLHDGTLQLWAFFVFWDNVSHSLDSRKVWAVWIESFQAKVILK